MNELETIVGFHDYVLYPTTIKYHPYNSVCFLIWSISEAANSSIILICSLYILKETKWLWPTVLYVIMCCA